MISLYQYFKKNVIFCYDANYQTKYNCYMAKFSGSRNLVFREFTGPKKHFLL